jgi:hypothetical protein
MTHDDDPGGIQRQPPSLATGPSPADKEPTLLPRRRRDADLRLPRVYLLLRRLPVLGAGLALLAVFALWVACVEMPSGLDVANRALIWLCVMGGPIVGEAWGMAEYYPVIRLGLLMTLAHPCWSRTTTACITLAGFGLWCFAGFLVVMVATWGA